MIWIVNSLFIFTLSLWNAEIQLIYNKMSNKMIDRGFFQNNLEVFWWLAKYHSLRSKVADGEIQDKEILQINTK